MTHDRERLRYLGTLGGRSLLAKRGRRWLQKIGRRGGEVTAMKYDYDVRRAWGSLGPIAKEKRDALELVKEERDAA
jgi:hypothetical protein